MVITKFQLSEPKPPYMSGKFYIEPKFEEKILVTKIYILGDVEIDYFIEEYFADEIKENPDFANNIEKFGYHSDLCLANYSQYFPKDAKLEDMFLTIKIPRYREYISVQLVYRTLPDLEAWRRGKQQEEEKYNKEYQEYIIKKKEYDQQKTQFEIEVLQGKLKELNK